MAVEFYRQEVRDLVLAWLALGLAFALFLGRPLAFTAVRNPSTGSLVAFGGLMLMSLLTVGVGFLLHELAHKVVAVRFDQVAAFRADYGMLGLAIAGGLAGFLFAAPGAVYHRGRITARENGIIAVAGPVTNLVLAVAFAPLLLVPGFVGVVGTYGVRINLILAGFNMLPWGPLDGRKVLAWDKPVFAAVFVVSVGGGLAGLFLL